MFFDTIKRAAGNQHVVYGNDVEGTLLEHDKHVVAGAPINRNPWCPMNIALQPVCAVFRGVVGMRLPSAVLYDHSVPHRGESAHGCWQENTLRIY